MSKSWKRSQREFLGKESPVSESEYKTSVILADIIEATPLGQRSSKMTQLLNDVRAAQLAHPEAGS